MKATRIRYDDTGMMAQAVGRFGAGVGDLKSLASKLDDARHAILGMHERGEQGWMRLPDDREMLKEIRRTVTGMDRYGTCLVCGIGGSDLGARAMYAALAPKKKKLVFLGANTDPDELHDIVSSVDLHHACINLISKSGSTIEPVTSFFYVYELMRKDRRITDPDARVVATTDPASGELRSLALKKGWATLPIPANVGGRFSTLSTVGLFPLAFAGASPGPILAGARDIASRFEKERVEDNAVLRYAAHHALAYLRRKQRVHVLMPYASRLRAFAEWYRQLWAESLGKKDGRRRTRVFAGPTPVAALGATDQHSQIQLYTEGPNDKTVTFLEVARFRHDLRVPKQIRAIPSLAPAGGKRFRDILHAERAATSMALTQAKRPNGTLMIPRISEDSMGALFMFFELAVAVMGELLDINAYNQPGVESGKKMMYAILKAHHK